MKMFPILRESGYKKCHPIEIPWEVAEIAYGAYRDDFGSGQSLAVLASRGGFSPSEMDRFYPDWRQGAEDLMREGRIASDLAHALRRLFDACEAVEKCERPLANEDICHEYDTSLQEAGRVLEQWDKQKKGVK